MSEELQKAATVVLVRDGVTGPEILLIHRPERGSFAGAWVFPGGKVDAADAATDRQTELRNAAVRETAEEVGLHINQQDLTLLSSWQPPQDIPVRILTWFFLAPAPRGEIVMQQSEVVETVWITAADMLALHARGEVILFPPTFVTLDRLSAFASVSEMLAAVRGSEPAQYRTRLQTLDGVPVFMWQGDAQYDQADAAVDPDRRHRIVAGRVPWTYERPTN